MVRIPPLHINTGQEVTHVPDRWAKRLTSGVVYEDDGLLVLNKPAGLAVHGGSGLSYGLIECLRLVRPQDHYLELVHRLDRETSGILLIARKASVLKDLHRQLREEYMDKRYLALVAGTWPRRRSFVEAPLLKTTVKSGERIVRVDKQGKSARTDFKVLRRFEGVTLVEARPLTGRTHQIRVHAQFAGHPLLGDEKYQSPEVAELARRHKVPRLFLHAAQLSFRNAAGDRQQVSAPLEPELQAVLDQLSALDAY